MSTSRVVLPPVGDSPAPARVPLVAVAAPVIVALAVWMVTGHALMLLFAALGPLTAVASTVDQRWTARRRRRATLRRVADRVAAASETVRHEHAAEAAARRALAPDGPAIVAGGQHDPGRWRGGPPLVTVGLGPVASAVEVIGPPDLHADDADQWEHLLREARSFEGAVQVDAGLGITVIGAAVWARAVWRGLAVQLLRRYAPEHCRIETNAHDERWLNSGVFDVRQTASDEGSRVLRVHSIADSAVLAWVAWAADREVAEIGAHLLELRADGAHLTGEAPAGDGAVAPECAVRPSAVSQAEARAWSAQWSHSRPAGRGTPPDDADLAALLADVPDREPLTSSEAGLRGEFAVSATGTLAIDLVEHGPHALVAGTTGSGKSELLVSWVVALAARYSPAAATFLLVDFKGGAAFAPLVSLPHVVGVVTDLDEERVERALTSLRAELQRRERLCAQGAVVGTSPLARLVIVVDEFAAMVEAHPGLQVLMTDIAARGRSLGMHLVLCTQRPSGVVRDGLLANADCRISLRVNNVADSRAVIDRPDAAALDARRRGRAWVRRAGEDPVLVQVARTSTKIVTRVGDQWRGVPIPERPWREPLPALVGEGDLGDTGPGTAIGLADQPALQRWSTARWIPEEDGPVLVVGAPRSGRTTALAALGGARVSDDPLEAWDAVMTLLERLDTGQCVPGRPAIDDLDTLLARFDPEYRAPFIDALARLVREGPAQGLMFVLAARRLTGELAGLAGLLPTVLRLRHASRHEWLLSGGEPTETLVAGPPGSARWRGERIQLVAGRPDRRFPIAATPTEATDPGPGLVRAQGIVTPLVIVSGTPAGTAAWRAHTTVSVDEAALRTLVCGEVALGDVDEWASRWGLLGRLRRDAEVVFVRCSIADVRALTRTRSLPPPLPPGAALAWRWRADDVIDRVPVPVPAMLTGTAAEPVMLETVGLETAGLETVRLETAVPETLRLGTVRPGPSPDPRS